MRIWAAARTGIVAMSSGRPGADTPRFDRVRDCALAAGICLIASLLTFLNHNAYPIASLETGLSFLILSAIAVSFGFVCAKVSRRERFLLSMLFVVLIVQMNFNAGPLLVAITFAAAILLGNSVLPFAGIVFFVVFLFQAVESIVPPASVSSAPAREMAKPPPLVVHVLLDGAVGIEGMPKDISEAAEAAVWAKEWLAGKGFAVFGRAYSEHFFTVNSVPHLFGFGVEGEVEKSGHDYSLGTNRYMTALRDQGYSIKVYQNDIADYCGDSDADTCWTASGFRAVSQSAFSPFEKTWVLMYSFASLSLTFEFTARAYDYAIAFWPAVAKILPPLDWINGPIPSALGGMEALDRLMNGAASAKDGEVHFAHVLVPHGPYAYDADCSLKPPNEWLHSGSHFIARQDLYRAYAAQWRCTLRRIGELVDTLEASRPDDSFIVIVHGDHGSRISPLKPNTDNADKLLPQHIRDCYSTLVAIRMPGLAPGYRREVFPVQTLLRDLVEAGFRGPFTPRVSHQPSVLLNDPLGLTPEERFAVPQLFD